MKEILSMDIRVLRYFITIAREGSITRAAGVLHMTQPPLSRQMHELEQELDTTLFLRGNKRITLTPQGLYLLERAKEIVASVDQTVAEIRAMKPDRELEAKPEVLGAAERTAPSQDGPGMLLGR
jgi:DNA-binding transcriptional LysR family regulator